MNFTNSDPTASLKDLRTAVIAYAIKASLVLPTAEVARDGLDPSNRREHGYIFDCSRI